MRAARLWPLALVAVLGITVGANALLFRAARDRNAAAVEPDYYHQAMRWDSTLAEQRSSAALGWRLVAELGALSSAGTPLTVRLTGRDGAPLEGAVVEVAGVHNLEAARQVSARLEPRGSGIYATRLPLRHAGLWELRFDVTRGPDHLRVALRRDVARGTGR